MPKVPPTHYCPDEPGKHTIVHRGVIVAGTVIERDSRLWAYSADGEPIGEFASLEYASRALKVTPEGGPFPVDIPVALGQFYKFGALFAAYQSTIDAVLQKYTTDQTILRNLSDELMVPAALNERDVLCGALTICGANAAELQLASSEFHRSFVAGSATTGGRA